MPYVIRFVKRVEPGARDEYFNDCCIGGDVVLDHLLPALRSRYGSDLQSTQEDWGWFVWFADAGVQLAVDVHTDDHGAGEFQLRLTARRPRFLRSAKVEDTPELATLRELVVSRLQAWPVERLVIEHVDEHDTPV